MNDQQVIRRYLKVYADLPGEFTNRYFCFSCIDFLEASQILSEGKLLGIRYRAIYYDRVNLLDSKKSICVKVTSSNYVELLHKYLNI